MRSLLFAAAGALFVLPAHAAGREAWVCDNAANNAEHTQCADREFRKYDAEMNKVYKQLLAEAADIKPEPGYGPAPQEALRQSQRAWLSFRDTNCHWKATTFYGGSQQAVIRVSCIALTTKERVEELKAQLRSD